MLWLVLFVYIFIQNSLHNTNINIARKSSTNHVYALTHSIAILYFEMLILVAFIVNKSIANLKHKTRKVIQQNFTIVFVYIYSLYIFFESFMKKHSLCPLDLKIWKKKKHWIYLPLNLFRSIVWRRQKNKNWNAIKTQLKIKSFSHAYWVQLTASDWS